MNDWVGLGWLVGLLLANAFFVAGEFAVISARRSQIEPLAEKGSRAAKSTIWAMEHATLILAMCQLGVTVCSLLILNVSEPALHHLLSGPLAGLGWNESIVETVSFIFALLVVSFLHVVFGEMVAKNLSFAMPERAALLLAPALVFLALVFRPLIATINGCANLVLRIFRVEPKNEATSTFTLDEVRTIVAHSRNEGVLDDTSGTLSAAFEFTTKQVCDVQIPLASVVSLTPKSTPEDVERAVSKHGFSRYPVLGEGGEPEGYVHVKDVIDLHATEFLRPLPSKRIRHLVSIFEATELEDALANMRRRGTHVARVADENGVTTGVLFLEDIIEVLVGEVRDGTRRV